MNNLILASLGQTFRTSTQRRDFIKFIGGVAAAAALFGCTAAQIAEWVSAEQAIGQEFTIVEPELVALGFNPSASVMVVGQTVRLGTGGVTIDGVTTTLPAIAALIQNLTSALGAASAVSDGQTALIKVEAYINALTPVIMPIVTPIINAAVPGSGLTIGLIVAAIPAVEGLLNWAVDFGETLLSPQAQVLAKTAPTPPAALRFHPATGAALTQAQQALALLRQRAGK